MSAGRISMPTGTPRRSPEGIYRSIGMSTESLVVIGSVTMSGASAIFGCEGRAMVHRWCHIIIIEREITVSNCLVIGVKERLSVCGVLCCVKLAVLLVVTVL
ncbi:hypothetical protein [Nocardia sp. CA-120079]|uniref:hypothetical protein n=1 Tax=Nocardia sp. CA-120079 TaxID=3239974 RepID=UPI003D99C3FB